MNINALWSYAALTAELCEVITWLEDDPHYTKEDASKQLRTIIEMHVEPLHDKAMSSIESNSSS